MENKILSVIKRHGRFFPRFTYKGFPLFPKIEKLFEELGLYAKLREEIELENQEAASMVAVFGKLSSAIKIAEEKVQPEEVAEYICIPPSTVKAHRSKRQKRRDAKLTKKTLKGILEGNPEAIKEAMECLK